MTHPLELEQRAAGVGGRAQELDALAADGVVNDLVEAVQTVFLVAAPIAGLALVVVLLLDEAPLERG